MTNASQKTYLGIDNEGSISPSFVAKKLPIFRQEFPRNQVRDFMTIFVGRMSNNMIMDPAKRNVKRRWNVRTMGVWCGL